MDSESCINEVVMWLLRITRRPLRGGGSVRLSCFVAMNKSSEHNATASQDGSKAVRVLMTPLAPQLPAVGVGGDEGAIKYDDIGERRRERGLNSEKVRKCLD
jgi:hypothetical protein